ncbi:hypothetical protein, partial [Clostridium perfringens]|uniref:hypothetical protein n=1 Tax=Clostridium perfringens TaxID=1502 RepID=UPI002ACC136D
VASNNIVVNVDKVISNDIEYPNIIIEYPNIFIEYPNIIVIPGDKGSCLAIKDSYLRKYILAAYNNCDYMATFSNAIYFLNELNGINGISTPKSIWKIDGTVEIEESFADNGKLILSSNHIGSIEACLN